MNNKIIIIVSIIIIITIGISAFSFTQSELIEKQPASQGVEETIEKQPASQGVENEEVKRLLEKVEAGRLAAKLSGKFFIDEPRVWLTSGPFQIDRDIYHLGEKIFINVEPIRSDVEIQMIFSKIYNNTHVHEYKKLSFDGLKQQQNQYFSVYPSVPKQFCTVDNIVGDWIVTFQGANLKPLEFKIINEFIPGLEDNFEPVC